MILHRGPIPPTMWVLHRCDTRPCVNPEHLFLGTRQDNIRDCVSKGRHVRGAQQSVLQRGKKRGEDNPMAALAAGDVREIRDLVLMGMSHGRAGARFGVSDSAVYNIVHGKTWAWLP